LSRNRPAFILSIVFSLFHAGQSLALHAIGSGTLALCASLLAWGHFTTAKGERGQFWLAISVPALSGTALV
jgi:hypothetical protein